MSETEELLGEDEFVERVEEATPSGFDRTSEETARVVLEKLLPQEEVRLEVLSFFAQAILIAHQQGEAKWGVTLYPNAVALNVSGFYACWVRSADFFVSLMEDALAPEVRTALENKVKWNGAFRRLPGSRCVYIPYAKVDEILRHLLTPTEEFVIFTATRFARMGSRVEGAHSPGVLRYLRGYLETDLPEPVYLPEEEEAEDDDGIDVTTDAPHFWKIAPGEGAHAWNDCRNRGCIAIGWLASTDYRTLATKEEVVNALAVAGSPPSAYTPIRQFTYGMKPGDIVVANKGRRTVIGVGRITSDYLPPDDPANVRPNDWLTQSRRVDWLIQKSVDFTNFRLQIRTISSLDNQKWKQIKQAYLMCYPDDADLRQAFAALEQADVVDPLPPPPVPEAVKPLLQMAERTKNILLYGPPGTGKTWLVTQFARAFTDADKVEMVTFHQSFAYEEFVEGVKPVIHEGQVSYAVVDGVFKRACRTAEKNPDGEYLIIIDEINRANIAKVLGELITLIEDDKRLTRDNAIEVTLPYSGERFGVPPNLTILGTMNTADRSIALLDLALRRRFTFVEMPPKPELLSEDVAGVNLRAVLTQINERVALLLDPDHRIGHSYLMAVQNADDLQFAWYRRIVPLLQEYFYHDGERLQAVVGKAFVTETMPDPETREALGNLYEEGARYEVLELEGQKFLEALRGLAGNKAD